MSVLNMTELDMVRDARKYLLANGGTPGQLAMNAELIERYSRTGTAFRPSGAAETRPPRGDGDTAANGVDYAGTGATTDLPEFPTPAPASRDLATPKQVAYATTLFTERHTGGPGANLIPTVVATLPQLTRAQISTFIDSELAHRKRARTAPAARPAAGRDEDLPRVPDGRYAVSGTLYRISSPTKGHWAGRVFIVHIDTHGQDVARVTAHDAKLSILNEIAADVLAAMTGYGKATGVCGKCETALEDPVSVDRGIGPVCEFRITGVHRRKADYAEVAARNAS